jgi:hypothetical protein
MKLLRSTSTKEESLLTMQRVAQTIKKRRPGAVVGKD